MALSIRTVRHRRTLAMLKHAFLPARAQQRDARVENVPSSLENYMERKFRNPRLPAIPDAAFVSAAPPRIQAMYRG